MAKKNFLILGVDGEDRFEGYSRVLKEMGEKHARRNYFDVINNINPIPFMEGDVITKFFSPWNSYRLRIHFHDVGFSDDSYLEKIAGESFLSALPRTTAGFKNFLHDLDSLISAKVENPIYINTPEEIAMGRDKYDMSKFFMEKEVPHPRTFFDFKVPDDVYAVKEQNQIGKLFFKIHSGSLGRGIAVLEGDEFYSTIEKDNRKFVAGSSARKVNEKDEQKAILEFMIAMKSIAQEGIDLAKISGANYDVRANFVYGAVPWSGLRVSNTHVTNWSLGGTWIEEKDIGNMLPSNAIQRYKDLTLFSANNFLSKEIGMDICFDKDYKNAYCLEANFFPGLSEREMRILYPYEISKSLKKNINENI